MKVRNTMLPASRVAIDSIGDKTTATLWDGTYTVYEAAVSDDEAERPGVEYEYELYQIDVQMRPGLEEVIEANFDVWYTAAKEQEKTREASNEAEKIEREMYANILKMLLDHDFRIMMLEKNA